MACKSYFLGSQLRPSRGCPAPDLSVSSLWQHPPQRWLFCETQRCMRHSWRCSRRIIRFIRHRIEMGAERAVPVKPMPFTMYLQALCYVFTGLVQWICRPLPNVLQALCYMYLQGLCSVFAGPMQCICRRGWEPKNEPLSERTKERTRLRGGVA